jgi:hypothetical protein
MSPTVRRSTSKSSTSRAVAVVGLVVSDGELSRLGRGVGLDKLSRYNSICCEMGWHLQFLTVTSPRLTAISLN